MIFDLLRQFGLDLPAGDSFIAAIRDMIDKGQQDVLDHKLNNKGQVGPGDKTGPKDSNNPKNPVMNPDQKGGDGDTKNTNPLDLPHLLPPGLVCEQLPHRKLASPYYLHQESQSPLGCS